MLQPQIPSIWREELWHPLSVHLPLGVLCVATLAELLSFLFLGRGRFFKPIATFLLLVGVPAAWLSVYLGGIAEDVVNKVICDPTVTHAHEDAAMLASYLFSAALSLKFALATAGSGLERFVTSRLLRHSIEISPLLIMFLGTYYLVYTSHLGATLVYNQGAGVYKPSAECREFN